MSFERECDCAICAPELWEPSKRGRLMSGLALVGEYPSLLKPPHLSPRPLLLDTCVIQHLVWARERAPELDDQAAWKRVLDHYGSELGLDLKALKGLVETVDREAAGPEPETFFVVGRSSWDELQRAPHRNRDRLISEWRLWRQRATTPSFPGESEPHPTLSAMPAENGWPPPGQDSLPGMEHLVPPQAPLGPFNDIGDAALVREAMTLDVQGILTTDLRSVWRHRAWLYERGIEVWRPSHLSCSLLDEALVYSRGEGIIPAWPDPPRRTHKRPEPAAA